MRIVWDETKRSANLLKHGMDVAQITYNFFATAVIVPAKRGRKIAIGKLNGSTTVIFAELGVEAISIVSMRPASEKERRLLDV